MRLRNTWIASILLVAAILPSCVFGATVDLEDLSLAPNSFFNGNPGGLVPPATVNGSFASRGATFSNQYSVQSFSGFTFSIWDGFAYSNKTDSVTPGFGNQYSAVAGSGFGGSRNYAIGFDSGPAFIPTITLPLGQRPLSVGLTNTTYVYDAIVNGNDGGANFARQFTTGDYFKLTITGLDGSNNPTGVLDEYLADYRSANPALHTALNNWQTFDLSTLGPSTRKLQFGLTTTDTGVFGANTPLYFALDQLITTSSVVSVPEPPALGMGLVVAGIVVVAMRMRRGLAA